MSDVQAMVRPAPNVPTARTGSAAGLDPIREQLEAVGSSPPSDEGVGMEQQGVCADVAEDDHVEGGEILPGLRKIGRNEVARHVRQHDVATGKRLLQRRDSDLEF